MTQQAPAPALSTPEATAPRRDLVSRSLTVAPYVFLGVLLLLLVRRFAAPVTNADTFFHLRYGHEFLHGWSIWHPGHVSTLGQRDWVPTQWASQVAMAAMESWFGLAGVAWLAGTLALATAVATFLVARRHADPLPSAVVTVLASMALSSSLSPRPQVVSYLLVLLVTQTWLRTAEDLRPRWWLVPVTWAWASLHGMWPLAALIGLVAVLGIALDRQPERRTSMARLVAVPVLCLVAGGLSPVGPRLYGAVLLVGGRSRFHTEWGPTDFHALQAMVAAGMVALTLVGWLRAPRGAVTWTPLLLLLLAAGWSAYAVRTVPVAAMMTVPLLAAALQRLAPRRAAPARERAVVALVALGALAALTASVPFTADQPPDVPSWLDPELDRLPAGSTVQTTDVFGGYLLWRHPRLNPVIDGYSDAYTTRHLQEQLDLQELRPGWDRTLSRSGARIAMLPSRSGLAYALTRLEGWRTVHRSADVVLLSAPPGWSR